MLLYIFKVDIHLMERKYKLEVENNLRKAGEKRIYFWKLRGGIKFLRTSETEAQRTED